MSERRLRVRVGIGALLIAAVVWIAIHDTHAGFRIATCVAAALGAVALLEFARMTKASAPLRAASIAGCLVLFWRTGSELVSARGAHEGWFVVAFGAACMAPVVTSVISRRTATVVADDARDLAMALLGLLLVVFPMLCLIEIAYLVPKTGVEARTCPFFSLLSHPITETRVGPWLLLVTVFTCKLNDIGGYLVGSAIGRTKLAPGISPKKSVEGAIAGLVLGVSGSVVAFTWFCPTASVLSPWQAGIFGLTLSITTQAGDLCESLIKRAAGVKDSAALIPAFGGILDLVDSFILAAPAGYTLLWQWIT